MSSINTNDFTRNLSRVLTASDQAKAPTNTDELKPSTFESLLLDTENTEEIENKPKVPAREVPENILTNKEDGEEIPVQKLTPQPSLSYIIGDIPLNEVEESVKIESPTVNVEEVKVAGPPQTPEIVSSKRFSLPKGRELETVLFDKSEIQNIVITAGKYHGVDPNLGLAVAQVESSFKANAVSRDGYHSKGVFQLLDSTAGDMMQKTGMDEPYKPFDPSMNAFLGMGYLRRLHNLFSKDTNLTSSIKIHGANSADELEKIALAAYNAGEGNVARAQQTAISLGKDPGSFTSIEPHLPKITRGYVKRVGKLKTQFNEINLADDSESDDLA